MDEAREVEAHAVLGDKREKALDEGAGVTQKFSSRLVNVKAKGGSEKKTEDRRAFSCRALAGDLLKIRQISMNECYEDGQPRMLQSIVDEAFALFILSRELPVESMGFKPTSSGYRAAALHLLNASIKKKPK